MFGNILKKQKKQFVDLLRLSYDVIKAENPEAVVISGGTAGSSNAGDYIKEMVNAGALNYMDALGIHPYCLIRIQHVRVNMKI